MSIRAKVILYNILLYLFIFTLTPVRIGHLVSFGVLSSLRGSLEVFDSLWQSLAVLGGPR